MVFGAYAIFMLFWSSYIYFNAKITDADGEEVPAREAIYTFFKSAWVADLKQSLIDLRNYVKQHGILETLRQMMELSLDSYGEEDAYKVMSLCRVFEHLLHSY